MYLYLRDGKSFVWRIRESGTRFRAAGIYHSERLCGKERRSAALPSLDEPLIERISKVAWRSGEVECWSRGA